MRITFRSIIAILGLGLLSGCGDRALLPTAHDPVIFTFRPFPTTDGPARTYLASDTVYFPVNSKRPTRAVLQRYVIFDDGTFAYQVADAELVAQNRGTYSLAGERITFAFDDEWRGNAFAPADERSTGTVNDDRLSLVWELDTVYMLYGDSGTPALPTTFLRIP